MTNTLVVVVVVVTERSIVIASVIVVVIVPATATVLITALGVTATPVVVVIVGMAVITAVTLCMMATSIVRMRTGTASTIRWSWTGSWVRARVGSTTTSTARRSSRVGTTPGARTRPTSSSTSILIRLISTYIGYYWNTPWIWTSCIKNSLRFILSSVQPVQVIYYISLFHITKLHSWYLISLCLK